MYIIEYIAQNKIEPLFQAFAERLEIIESIRDYFSNNKKLVDLANSVLNTFNPTQNKLSTPVYSIDLINEEPVRKKFDLLVKIL